MVGKICQWLNCESNSRCPQTLSNNVTFIPFIKPSQDRERCLRWIKACGRPLEDLNIDGINRHKYICSKHFQEVTNGKPSSRHPDPTPDVPDFSSHRSHSRRPKPRQETRFDSIPVDDKNRSHRRRGKVVDKPESVSIGENEGNQELVMKLTFDESGEGISEEIHTSLTRALRKNETQLCSNTRCVNQTNSLIQELQHAIWVERRLKERVQYLHHIANINLDLLNVCVDEKKNPVVKVELNKVYKLLQAIMEVHKLFASEFNSDKDDEDDEHDRINSNSGVQETNQSSVGRRVLRNHTESTQSRFDITKEKDNTMAGTDRLLRKQNNKNYGEDCDLRDVDSIMDVVNSCAFKTIEDNDSSSTSGNGAGFLDYSNVIPLLDFKDIPMLNVTNLPRGLSLVNNTPVINLNTEGGSDGSTTSPNAKNAQTLSVGNSAGHATVDIVPKCDSSKIPILNGPLLNFVNKITSPNVKSRPRPQRRKKRKRTLRKRVVIDEDDDDDNNDADEDENNDDEVDNDDDKFTKILDLNFSPIENEKPKIRLKITAPKKANDKCHKIKSNSKTNKGLKMNKVKPFKKREDPLRGVTASRVMCEVCGKLIACSSTKSWHFQSHMRKFHTGEKPEKCDVCDKRFHDSAALRSHMQYIHSQGRPHQCAVCGKSFKSRENLRKHGLVHTTEGTVYACLICNKKFKRSDCLKNHQRIFHKRKNDNVEPEPITSAIPPSPPSLLSLSTTTISTCAPPQPPSSTSSHPLPPEAHAYPPSSSSYLHNPLPDLSHDIPWDGRAVPIPPVPMYGLPGMHAAHMEFPPWHPLK